VAQTISWQQHSTSRTAIAAGITAAPATTTSTVVLATTFIFCVPFVKNIITSIQYNYSYNKRIITSRSTGQIPFWLHDKHYQGEVKGTEKLIKRKSENIERWQVLNSYGSTELQWEPVAAIHEA